MILPISLIVAHFIGDFLLQSDWMALNKSKSWHALIVHVWTYTAAIFVWGLFYFGLENAAAGLFVVTFVTHFVTDAITSRITSRLWFFEQTYEHKLACWTYVEGKRHWFFVMIGLDQLIHYGTLAWTLNLIL